MNDVPTKIENLFDRQISIFTYYTAGIGIGYFIYALYNPITFRSFIPYCFLWGSLLIFQLIYVSIRLGDLEEEKESNRINKIEERIRQLEETESINEDGEK